METNTAGIEGDRRNSSLRIAIVSTPRSGNTWLRRLVADTYALKEQAVYSPDEVTWDELPPRFVLQIHWHRINPFLSLLEQQQFRVVVLSRHPLDVLISILHFAPNEHDTAQWLDGEEGGEAKIFGASPCSPVFLDYATSPRAAILLNVSREWARSSRWFRYEDIVRDPAEALCRLGLSIGHEAYPETITKAIATNSIEKLRSAAHNQHFWRGQPGHWKHLLPAAEAHKIAQAHRAVFDEFGYECDPDESLSKDQADANWAEFR